jgi:hypothetical protein
MSIRARRLLARMEGVPPAVSDGSAGAPACSACRAGAAHAGLLARTRIRATGGGGLQLPGRKYLGAWRSGRKRRGRVQRRHRGAPVRGRICVGMEWTDLVLDHSRKQAASRT